MLELPRRGDQAAEQSGGAGAAPCCRDVLARGNKKTESKSCFPAPPFSRLPDSGAANRRGRVSPPPWQVAFALDFAGQGRPSPTLRSPRRMRGRARARGGPGRRAEGPGAGEEPPALEANQLANVALPFGPCPPARVAARSAPEIHSGLGDRRSSRGTERRAHVPHPVSHRPGCRRFLSRRRFAGCVRA